jgi:hypothetical protein
MRLPRCFVLLVGGKQLVSWGRSRLPVRCSWATSCFANIITAKTAGAKGIPECFEPPRHQGTKKAEKDRERRPSPRCCPSAWWAYGFLGVFVPYEARPSTSTTRLPSVLNYPGGNVVLHTAARVEILHLSQHRRQKSVRHLGQPDKGCPIVGLQNILEVFRGTPPLRKSPRSCLGRPKRLIQVGDDVVHIFDAHR